MRLSIIRIFITQLLVSCTHRQVTEHAVHPPAASDKLPQEHTSNQAEHRYSVGMSRAQVKDELANSYLLVSASRPKSGWSIRVSRPAGGRAARFESSHNGRVVQTCEVYWVGHTNAPRIYCGIWLDYFYFDRDEKLIGYDRFVID